MKRLKYQLILTVIAVIAIFIFWLGLTILRAILSLLSTPMLIVVIFALLYKFITSNI